MRRSFPIILCKIALIAAVCTTLAACDLVGQVRTENAAAPSITQQAAEGRQVTIRIDGQQTFGHNSSIVYVMDDQRIAKNDLRSINPAGIKAIRVLKAEAVSEALRQKYDLQKGSALIVIQTAEKKVEQ